MSKTKRFTVLIALISVIALLFACVLCMGNTVCANAEEVPAEGTETPVTPAEGSGGETDKEGLQTLVDGFLARLKAKYGDDYETYYNAILAEWGSVEEYLLSLADEDAPDGAASGWTAFVKWLGEYAPIWGGILAVGALIIVILCGKKALNKVSGFVTGTGGKFKTVFKSINKMYRADIAEMNALIKLLGENERFARERKELEEAIGEIEQDEDV